MKAIKYMIWIGACLAGLSQNVSGQIKYELSAKYMGGKAYNIFHTPDTVKTRSLELGSDSLIQNDFFNRLDLSGKLRKGFGRKFYVKIDQEFSMKRYISVTEADQSKISIKPSYAYRFSEHLKTKGMIGFQRSKKLAIDILGDELLKKYSNSHFFASQQLIARPWLGNLTAVKATVGKKKYDRLANEATLTYNYKSLEAYVRQRFLNHHALKAAFEYTLKEYEEWFNDDLVLETQTTEDSVPISLAYMSGTFSVRSKANDRWMFNPYIRYLKRIDLSYGDFGYKDIRLGLRSFLRFNKVELEMNGYVARKSYDDRLARQESGAGNELLEYDYIWFQIIPKFQISKSFKLFSGVDYLIRSTNTTDISKKYRRPFETYKIYLGIQYDIKGKLAASGRKR